MRQVRMTIGLIVLLCISPGCASVKTLAWNPFNDRIKDRENRYTFAQLMERNGDNARAERNYRTLAQEKPKDARYCHRLGTVLVRQGKFDEGIDMLNRAHDLDKDNLAILNDLGYAYTVEGKYERAESVLREAMKLDSRDVRTQNNLAMVLGYIGKTDEAYELFRRNSDEGIARSNMAYIYAQTGHVDMAVKEYSKALSHSPGNKSAAEALVQLNTLQRTLAAKEKMEKTESKVQLASEQAFDHELPKPQKTALTSGETQERSDLVQLLNKVEDTDDVTEPEAPQGPILKPEVRSVKAVREDYDWSSTP